MGFRYNKRLGGSRGWGLNVSGSGITPSYRSKYGSVGPRGFSIRTGIPGLSFRQGFGKSKGNGAVIALVIWLAVMAFISAAIVGYNLIRLTVWLVLELYHLCLRVYYKWRMKQETNGSNQP
ncbi:hypothetical protein [Pontibacter kalidii]|uniref:hypothetical protein n=1 Tax=Pontibacter kalidii TaxID=2592049 RepID=UPI002253D314|nr:hypothetical protein [Pontibacter kalidii]